MRLHDCIMDVCCLIFIHRFYIIYVHHIQEIYGSDSLMLKYGWKMYTAGMQENRNRHNHNLRLDLHKRLVKSIQG